MAHGTSAAVDFALRKESNPDRIRALLDLSGSTLGVMSLALLVLMVAGVAAGFVGKWWGLGWIWTALALLIGLSGWMSWYSRKRYSPLRKAAGPYMEGNKPHDAETPLSDAEIAALAATINPRLTVAVGYGVLAVIVWLMMFKPF